jgi:hypothetical protein
LSPVAYSRPYGLATLSLTRDVPTSDGETASLGSRRGRHKPHMSMSLRSTASDIRWLPRQPPVVPITARDSRPYGLATLSLTRDVPTSDGETASLGLLLELLVSANLPAKHLIYKLWIFSERSTQTTHVDVSAFYSFRHTMATPCRLIL